MTRPQLLAASIATVVRRAARLPLAWRARQWAAVAVLAPSLTLSGVLASERVQLRDHVLPNVVFDGQPVQGYSRTALLQHLEVEQQRLAARVVAVQVGDAVFRVALSELGAALERERVVELLLGAGRSGHWWQQVGWRLARWWREARVPPLVRFDEQLWEAQLAAFERAVLQTPEEGGVSVEDGAVVTRAPRPGQRIDRQHARQQLLRAMVEAHSEIQVKLLQYAPSTTLEAVRAAAERAETIVSDSVALALLPPEGETEPLRPNELPESDDPAAAAVAERSAVSAVVSTAAGSTARESSSGSGGGLETLGPTFVVDSQQLARALRSRVDPQAPARLEVYLEPQQLEDWLEPLRQRWERPAADARFEVEKDAVQIVPGRVEWRLDRHHVAQALLAAADSPERRGSVRLVHGDPPRITTELAEQLNVHQRVARFTTRHPCCQPRVENIHRIADLLDGTILLPGEQLSVNERVGPRSEDAGFHPAPTIVRGEIRDTYGGGISQFATTLFNALLDGGYEIVERQPHSFYFSRYPLGHEATLSFPKPDLVFRNDTRSGLLIRTRYGSTYLTVELYGDNEGRQVEKQVSERYDWIEPELEYVADETLTPDEERVESEGERGFSVDVSRTVIELNGERRTEGRRVNYRPRPQQIAVHPCRIPEDEPGASGEPCPPPEPADAGAEAPVYVNSL